MKHPDHDLDSRGDGAAELEDDLACLDPGLESLCPEVSLSVRQGWVCALTAYARLLFRWSNRMNLIAPGDRARLASRHLMPSLALRPAIVSRQHACVLDVGSGAGLPGIPLKITLPESTFILLESRRRRTSFLHQVVRHLSLTKTEIVHSRLEDWPGSDLPIDIAVTRATMAPPDLLTMVSPCLPRHGVIVTTLPAQADATSLPRLLSDETVGGSWGERRVTVLDPFHQRG